MTVQKLSALLDKPSVSLLAAATTSGVAGLIDWAQSVTGTTSPVAAVTMFAGGLTACIVAVRQILGLVRDWRNKDKA